MLQRPIIVFKNKLSSRSVLDSEIGYFFNEAAVVNDQSHPYACKSLGGRSPKKKKVVVVGDEAPTSPRS